MDEQEVDPKIELNLGGEEYVADRSNATLYMFVGKSLSRSHVWLAAQNGEPTGYYLFHDLPAFTNIANFMLTNGFELHVNLREVPACDEDAYQRHIGQIIAQETIEDTIPEDWS